MYLSKLIIKNFRCFDDVGTTVEFNKGMNVLVGENDSGKTAIIDAIRIALGTTDFGGYRTDLSDFNNEDETKEIKITCRFDDLSLSEQATFLECLTHEGESVCLYLNWTCRYLLQFYPHRLSTNITSGKSADGVIPTTEAREMLRVTYLRPLRDAYTNMQSGRGSRLSQVLSGVRDLNTGNSCYTEGSSIEDLSLTGIVSLSDKLLSENDDLRKVSEKISSIIEDRMIIHGDSIQTKIEVAGVDASEERKLSGILEKLDLVARKKDKRGRVGLGTSNVVSMACELLLSGNVGSSFLLIEEPEAHIHAQRQLRIMKSLQEEAEKVGLQVFLTTHSPLLASEARLSNVIYIKDGKSFSLDPHHTNLDSDDYYYLERYLDATKANLFFAKSVMVVEGPSEELLIPIIAKLLGRDFSRYGVSIVNARGIGLHRFAGIFQRTKSESIPGIFVACVTDRDIWPDCAPERLLGYKTIAEWPAKRKWRTEGEITDKGLFLSEKCSKADGGYVKTFVSDNMTLEYDLAYAGLYDEVLESIIRCQYSKRNIEAELEKERERIGSACTNEEKCIELYSHFYRNNVSKPVFAQELGRIIEEKYTDKSEELITKLPKYIINSIQYVTEVINDGQSVGQT